MVVFPKQFMEIEDEALILMKLIEVIGRRLAPNVITHLDLSQIDIQAF